MSTQDRTWPASLDGVSGPVLERLLAAAEDLLERACDTGGDWDPDRRRHVLDAARVVFDAGRWSAGQVAELADRALELAFEGPIPPPRQERDLRLHEQLLVDCRELLGLRDAADAALVQETGPAQPA